MNLPERSPRPWLLSVLPFAWATSALAVLGEGGLLDAFLALAWLCVGWKYFAGRRAAVARRAIALLIAAALPAQGFAAIAAELSGPAHFHATPARERHWHAGVMHHHHAPGDAVVIDDGKRSHPMLASGETKRAASGAVDALAAAEPLVPALASTSEASPPRCTESPAHVTRPPERPPRLLRFSLPS
jgi:hypothetical protein